MRSISFIIGETGKFRDVKNRFFKCETGIELFIKQRIGRHKRIDIIAVGRKIISVPQINF